MKNIELLACCIAKNENDYIYEWVNYHLNLGFSKIIVFDNNNVGDTSVETVLSPFIKDGLVDVVDFRGKYKAQSDAYTQCYQTYNKQYDWIMFFDVDEFIQLDKKFLNIVDCVSQSKYSNYNAIRLCWKVYGDNDLVQPNKNFSITRFTTPSEYTFYNHYYKSFVRCNCDAVQRINAHGCYNIKNACYTNGQQCENIRSSEQLTVYDDMYIIHYQTKTISEFLHNKYNRGDASGGTSINTTIDFFFRFNEHTPEKDSIVNEFLKTGKVPAYIV